MTGVQTCAFDLRAATGIGALALGSLLNPRMLGAASPAEEKWPGVLQPLHWPAKAKRVIHLYMAGGPSHLETFDFKAKLKEMHGKPMPESLTKGQQIAQLQGKELKCFGPQYDFKKFGKSGQEMCELFPYLGKVADDICIIRSMHTDQINHDPAHTLMNTGSGIPGRPSMGSWLLYGLGSAVDNLPGYVVLTSAGKGGQMQPIAARQWSAGFLPGRFQGVRFHSKGDPVLYLGNPAGVTRDDQRGVIDAVKSLNAIHHSASHDPDVLTRISQYEIDRKSVV